MIMVMKYSLDHNVLVVLSPFKNDFEYDIAGSLVVISEADPIFLKRLYLDLLYQTW